jgi:hypothetical protein
MTHTFKVHPKCLLTELDDGTGVVLHLDTKIYYTLNETGVFVWKDIECSPREVEALVIRLTETFEVDREQAQADVAALIETLLSEGLLQRVDGFE